MPSVWEVESMCQENFVPNANKAGLQHARAMLWAVLPVVGKKGKRLQLDWDFVFLFRAKRDTCCRVPTQYESGK